MFADATNGSVSGDGSIDSPLDSIQDAIDDADTCVVAAAGTYYEALDFSGKSITVTGVDGPDSTTIDAGGYGVPAVTFVSGESAILDGFTITGGDGYLEETSSSYACTSITTCTDYYDTYAGGGIYIDGADPTIQNLIIQENELPDASVTTSGNDVYYVYSYGGGVYVGDGTLDASNVSFMANSADQGGGLYLDSASVVDLEGVWMMGNTASDGGGIEVDGGELYAENMASVWNEADSDGGGILLIDATLEAINILLGGDDAPTGGGLYASGSSSASVRNSIITESDSGEGVLVGGSSSFSGSYNNVVNNGGGNYSGISDPTGSSGNLSTTVGFTAWSDDGNITNEDISLTSSSAMIDAGDSSSAANDADGSRNDIGALGGANSDWDDGVPGID